MRERSEERIRRRLMVRYGEDQLDRTAFSQNISRNGLFLKTNNVLKPGTTIQVEIKFPERTFTLWARVMWAKRVPAQLAHTLLCGMGLRFVEPGHNWSEFFDRWRGK